MIRKDKVQLELLIESRQAGKTYMDLIKLSRALKKELLALEPGTDAFVKKSKSLKIVTTQLREISAETRGVSASFDKASGRTGLFKKALLGLGPIVAGAFAAQRIGQFITGLFNTSTELSVLEQKFSTVFGNAAGIVEASAERQAIALGLSRNEYKKLAAEAGDLLIPMGFQREEAAKLSTDILDLSGSLALWSQGKLSSVQVSQILQKAMLGEREQLTTLGIKISEAQVQARLTEKGQDKLTDKALEQAKALATLELMTEKSGDAQAFFADSLDNTAAKKARLIAKAKDLYSQLGQKFIPVVDFSIKAVEKLLYAIIYFGKTLGAIPSFIKENKVAIGSLIVALVWWNRQSLIAAGISLRMAAAQKIQAISTASVTVAQRALNVAMKANPVGLVITAISLLVAAFQIAYNKSATFRAIIAGTLAVGKQLFENFKITMVQLGKSIEIGFLKMKKAVAFKKEDRKRLADSIAALQEESKLIKKSGETLGAAFAKGYADSILNDKQKEQNKKIGEEIGDQTGEGIIDGINNRLAEEAAAAAAAAAAEEAKKKADAAAKKLKDKKPKKLKDKKAGSNDSQVFYEGLVAAAKKTADLRVAQIEAGLDQELTALERGFLTKVLTEEEYNAEVLSANIDAFDEKLSFMRSAGLKETDFYRKTELEKLRLQEEASKKRVELEEREAEVKKQIKQGYHDASVSFLELGAELLSQDEQQRKKHASAIKAFEAAKVLVNLGSEISGYFKVYSGIPGGQILAGVLSALAGVRAGLAINKIRSQKFAFGGFTGPGILPQDSTGRKPAGVVHEDEYVAPTHQIKRYPWLFSWLNNDRLRGFADGGFTSVDTTPLGLAGVNLGGPSSDNAKLGRMADALEMFTEMLPKALSNIRAGVDYGEIEAKANEMQAIKSRANI